MQTVHNPNLETGYWTIEAIAQLKGMTVHDLFLVYTVEHNVAEDGRLFYNLAAVTFH